MPTSVKNETDYERADARARNGKHRKHASSVASTSQYDARANGLSFVFSIALLAAVTGISASFGIRSPFALIILFALPAAVGAFGAAQALSVSILCAIASRFGDNHASFAVTAAILCIDIALSGLIIFTRRLGSALIELNVVKAILRTILDADTTGIVVLNRVGKVLHVSREAERICGAGFAAQNGLHMMLPDGQPITAMDLIASAGGLEASKAKKGQRRRLAHGTPIRDLIIIRADQSRAWAECRIAVVRVYKQRVSAVVLMLYDREIRTRPTPLSSQEERYRGRQEDREAMFRRLSQHLRSTLNPLQIQSIAAEELGKALKADRTLFLQFGDDAKYASLSAQWNAEGVPTLFETGAVVPIEPERTYRNGVTRISHDLRISALPMTVASVFEDTLGIRSAIQVPILDGEAITGALIVAMADQPREWTSDEAGLTESVAAQTRFVSEAARLLTAERRRAEREEMTNRIAVELRVPTDPWSIQSIATNELGRALRADRCYYIQYDLSDSTANIGPDYTHGSETLPLTGGSSLPRDEEFHALLNRARETIVVDDAQSADFPEASRLVQKGNEPIAAFIRVPLFSHNNAAAALNVTMIGAPRAWTADEVALVEAVAAQTCSAIASVQMLARERARAEREELFGKITAAIGQSQTASEAQREATVLLGSHLRVDRCYLIRVDMESETAEIDSDYCRQDLPSIVGSYALDSVDMRWLLEKAQSGETFDSRDLRRILPPAVDKSVGPLHLHRHRALLAIPLLLSNQVQSLLVLANADRPREWSADERQLVHAIALRMQASLQATALHEREHRIASILQTALLPDIPGTLQGLSVVTHYRAALQEASVGGDFYDVFPLDENRTALCIGDVSGKGLTAAAQLSTLRNMLRAALYREQILANALTDLNTALADHHLLNGFATLFASIYDTSQRRLNYVSCGHEPALLLRSVGGNPRVLSPTAPAIGVVEGAVFQEGSVILGPGDQLLLYTDGVSEAGKARSAMLGIVGLAQIAIESAAQNPGDNAAIMQSIVERVEQHSGGIFRDDICLLLTTAL